MKTFDEFLTPVHQIEWSVLCAEATIGLQGTCPLLGDETILKINEYLQYIQHEISKTPS